AHQPEINRIGLPQSVEQATNTGKMVATVVAQMVGDVGRAGQQFIHSRRFAIQNAQRVFPQSLLVNVGQAVMMRGEIGDEFLDITRLAYRAAGAVELEGKPLETQRPVEI